MEYFVPASLTQKRIKIAVVGAGGTGGEIMDLLTRLEFGLKAMGGQGIHVTLYDDDIVEQHNLGSSAFWRNGYWTLQIHLLSSSYQYDVRS